MPEDSPSIYTIMAERVANAILGKINALIGNHNTNEQAHQDIREDIPSASSTVPNADTTTGSYGSGASYARSNHTHPKSSLYAEASHNHSKAQITDFPTIPSKTSDLTNDSGFLTSHQSLSGYLQTSDVKDNLTSTDTNKPLSAKQGKELKTLVDGKQATLVSGTSIKTVNNESLLGSGNISISSGRDNEPLYFPTEVSLPTATTSANRRKFIHPPYKFKNIPNWTVEGEIKVTGSSARFELHKTDDTNLKNFIAVGKNAGGNLAYWWGTSSSAESSKTYSDSDIKVDTWYPFRISRMGDNVLFMFNNGYKHEVTTTYFNTLEDIEPSIFGYGTSGASVRNLKITPLEPVHPLSPSSSVCTNAQGIITTESKNNHTHSDTQLNWNGSATNNSVSPLLMAMDSEFGANRLAYFPSSRIKVEYSTNGGSTWTELTTGNYSEANKTKLVTTTSQYMFLGNGSTTDYSKNSLRITFDAGDMNADSILYIVTRKIALYTGTANATGFTCQIQTQTYAQYNSNSETFSNYGSAFSLEGWSGWNTYPINFTLGGYNASNQTNSSSTRIKAIRLLFSQTGGTGNGIVSRVRLYGETAYRTASQYANNNHIYTIDENQNAVFPSKIIKEGGTSSQFLMANGDVQNKVTSWSNTPSDTNVASEKLVKTELEEIRNEIDSIAGNTFFNYLDCVNTNFTYFTTQYLFDYLTDISDYYAQSLPNDTMGCGSTDSMSVTENDELLISDYQTRVFRNNTFTSSNHYVLELDLKKPNGAYKGADFEVMIGEPSKYIKFDSGYYGEFIHYLLEENGTQQEVSYQTTSDKFTDYFTLRITRNGNAWKGEWIVNDTILRTLEATTPLDISNKLGFCSYSWYNYNSDELYVKNIKITY